MPSRRAAIVLALACGAAPAAAGEVVERILAVVEGRPVMLSEVRLLRELRGVDLEAALEGLIDERLMHREASRLSQAAPTPPEEARAVESLSARLGPRASSFAAEDLRRVARRQAAILKYVEIRFRPQVRVGEAEVQEAYEAEYGGQPEAPPWQEAAPAVRRRLEDEDIGLRIEAWVRELRASAEVRYNDPGAP